MCKKSALSMYLQDRNQSRATTLDSPSITLLQDNVDSSSYKRTSSSEETLCAQCDPPFWLVSCWMSMYCSLLIGECAGWNQRAISLLFSMCSGLICGLILMHVYGVWEFVNNYCNCIGMLDIVEDCNQCVFDAQMGEILRKEDLRSKYRKKVRSYEIERTKQSAQLYKKYSSVSYDKQVRKNKRGGIYTPQLGGTGITKLVADFASNNGIPIDDDTLNRIENLGALFLAAKDCTTTTGFLATIFLYLKTHYSKSLSIEVAKYLSGLLEAEFDEQSGSFGVQSEKEKPKWLLLLKDLQTNWTLVIRNEGFTKISHVLSLCLALGLCDASSLDFRIGGMKLFSIGAFARHASAVDLIDAAFETIVYFAEGGYACFERGSLKPLLYGNMENEEFEEAYAKCLRCNEYARCGNLDKYESMSENDYEALLSQCIEKASTLANSCKGAVEKNVLRRKIDILRQWQATFRQTRVQGGLREAPYSIGIFGGTAVGKSTIANVLMVTTLLHNNYCASDDRIVTLNESDKFMSNFRSYTNGVLIDDIGNTKAAFVEKAPTTLMIQLVNNVRMYANMAEADMKGKVSVEPKVVIGTKNVKDTCATVYSNEPASITRRDRITLTCTVQPRYAVHGMLNEDLVKRSFPNGTPLIPDFWNITVQKSYPIPNKVKDKAATVGWETVLDDDGQPLEDISLPELIRWIGKDSEKFYANQRQFVKKNNNLCGQITLCPHCRFPTPDVCVCTKEDEYKHPIDSNCTPGWCACCDGFHKEIDFSDESSLHDDWSDAQSDNDCYDEQLGKYFVSAFYPRVRKWDRWWKPKIAYWTDKLEKLTVDTMLQRLDWLENSRWVCWTNWIPSAWIEKDWMKNIVWFTREDELRERIRRAYLNHICLICFTLAASALWSWVFLALIPLSLLGICGVVEKEKSIMYSQVASDNQAMPKIFKMYRDRHMKWITGTCAIIAALYAMAQIYKAFKVVPSPQGNIAPTTEQEIVERDEEVNPWAGVVVSPMPCTEKAKTTTPERLEQMVQANLCHMLITVMEQGEEKQYHCDAFFPKSNIALVPRHMWKAVDIKATFTRHSPDLIGGNFESYLCRNQSVDIPNTDLSCVWVPNGGDWKDLTEYFPLSRFASVPARLTYKKRDGTCIGSKLKMQVEDVVTHAASFFGASYTLSFETFQGLCMATLITETKGPLIGGFHLGGKNGECKGCSGLLLKSELDTSIEKLRAKSGVIVSKSSGEIPKELYDIQFYQNSDVHPKSPVNFLPAGTNCRYYGQVTGRASYYSEVETTIISKHVEEICGVPQKWGKPKFREGYPWQASLQYSTKPSCGIEGTLLEKASSDYMMSLVAALDKMPGLRVNVRPLNEMETVCGIDGLRFIDKMPPNTSIGYPLSGPKSQYLELLNPDDYPSHNCPAKLDERFWKMAGEMEELYSSGQRAYPIFKACLKDEPTVLTKDKVRVFQGAPVALQLLVRKYFLPIARVLSVLPLISECAVGVNAQGPEWDQLAKHVKRFGEDRILAGDYSKYDLRMPAQVMFAAFRILIDLARNCGYTERDVSIMEGVATDICYPLMAYNGDLIQHYGSNPSGQNLTVYINSIVNALLFRCAYFEILKHRPSIPPFKEVCSLITYGDDAKSSVHADYPEFNHIAVAAFLEARDMKFTMPDKTSIPTEYMTDSEADLLKRANVYCEDTGLIMGALDEDSIFKSLHATLKSKALTREQQSMQNIDGALREWFSHGREVYEKRREQMIAVAKAADLTHGCSVIHESYDSMLEKWRERYQ